MDNLNAYLKWKFPDRHIDDDLEDIQNLLMQLYHENIKKLVDLDKIIKKYIKAIEEYEKKYPPMDMYSDKHCLYCSTGMVRVALKFININKKNHSNVSNQKKLQEFLPLAQK